MSEVITKYGNIKGVYLMDKYLNGNPRDCVLNKPNIIKTKYGDLVPQYEDKDERRKCTVSIGFYDDGSLKNLSLQEQVEIETSLGKVKAEYIVFHKNGNIKRIFPLNGKLTGYWSEDEEYSLAEEGRFDFSFARFKLPIIGISFFENEKPRSITLWPKDKVTIEAPIGRVEARIGFSIYPSGKLQSFEPCYPLEIATPIGKIIAYDSQAIGVHADSNSVRFSEEGKLKGLKTTANKIQVIDKYGVKKVYEPEVKPSLISEGAVDIIPLNIEFSQDRVSFNNGVEYSMEECKFSIEKVTFNMGKSCSSCSSCQGCSS